MNRPKFLTALFFSLSLQDASRFLAEDDSDLEDLSSQVGKYIQAIVAPVQGVGKEAQGRKMCLACGASQSTVQHANYHVINHHLLHDKDLAPRIEAAINMNLIFHDNFKTTCTLCRSVLNMRIQGARTHFINVHLLRKKVRSAKLK